MGEYEQNLIKSLSVNLALASGQINSDEAAKAMGIDKVELKIDRKRVVQYATMVVKSLLKGK